MCEAPHWTHKITILSRLAGRDSVTRLDTWKKTVLHNCFFKAQVQSGISGTSAAVTQTAVCRIPQNPNYRPYHVWKNDISDGFSISVGDHIILGEVAEDIDASNVAEVVAKYRPAAMTVKAFSDNTHVGFLPHYRMEGV